MTRFSQFKILNFEFKFNGICEVRQKHGLNLRNVCIKYQRPNSSLMHLDIDGAVIYVAVVSVMQRMVSINMSISRNSHDV